MKTTNDIKVMNGSDTSEALVKSNLHEQPKNSEELSSNEVFEVKDLLIESGGCWREAD